MLIVDQLRKSDPQIRVMALLLLGGLGTLLVGLWWVQIVMSRSYQANLETQSYRSVRIPAVRGRLLDRNGVSLAENRPIYNISLYLEELRKPFDAAYFKKVDQARTELKAKAAALEASLGRSLKKDEKRQFGLSLKEKHRLRQEARAEVASNVVHQISALLRHPLEFEAGAFERHYQRQLALPFPVLPNATHAQIAVFQEHPLQLPGVDIEVQSMREYPFDTLAAHVLGRLKRSDDSRDGEEAFFSYRLPDYCGLVGLEAAYDRELRGTAGSKSVLVNNVGYRQTERVWVQAEPGRDLVLTIDWRVQQACERALMGVYGPTTTGAVVVLEVDSGDVLAMASSPTLNPNGSIQGFSHEEWQRITDLRAEVNRATQERYAPGSIFKTVVGLAALEWGIDPHEIHHAIPNPYKPWTAITYLGARHAVGDLAPPGDYDFKRALKLSSNSYFIHAALRAGPESIVRLGQRLHLGERTGLIPLQETAGHFPSLDRVTSRWTDGNTANLSIGQDPVLITPLQVAITMSAFANGGKVFWPRLAARLETPETGPDEPPHEFPRAQVRDELRVNPRNLRVLKDAMLADVEDPDGTGRRAAVPGLRVCGKTGTAQINNERNQTIGHTTWFASFAPYSQPRYAVVVMIENGESGGLTCAPVAAKVYTALLESEKATTGYPVARK